MDEWLGERVYGRVDGWLGGWVDCWMDGLVRGCTDNALTIDPQTFASVHRRRVWSAGVPVWADY